MSIVRSIYIFGFLPNGDFRFESTRSFVPQDDKKEKDRKERIENREESNYSAKQKKGAASFDDETAPLFKSEFG